MPLKIVILIGVVASIAGVGFGYFLRWIIALGQKGSLELRLKQIDLDARENAKKILEDAEKRAVEIGKELRDEIKERENKNKSAEDRLIKKEESLDHRQSELDKEIGRIREKAVEIKTIEERTRQIESSKSTELERVANLSEKEAKDILLSDIERKFNEDLSIRLQKLELQGAERFDLRAKSILTTSIHRLANSVSSEVFTTSVAIPGDEIKGKIIGKEGRNIKAFERASGVELIVDDTPGLITISSFDSVRRQVAKTALENLIADGRIQPAKIEESLAKAEAEINQIMKEKAEAAAYECGVFNLPHKLMVILGKLHFRTSYGQNVLQHSIEMAHIAGIMAIEIGANVSVAKAGALLHDIGKAADHEVLGTHVEIGRVILQKFNMDEAIIRAMEAHHEEYPYATLESYIVQAADAISGGRPGARRDSVENYIKRLTDLENIAKSYSGVEKAYAIQAGREVRVFVTPSVVNDLEARKIAREVAVRVEHELKYPGEIKVVVIRESRSIEFAR